MLPYAHDNPTGTGQSAVGVQVPPPVTVNLGRPVPVVDLMTPPAMVRATVPETAVHKNGYTCRPEHDVCLAAQARQGRPVKAVTQAQSMQGLAQGDLRSSTFPALPAHPLSN